jgi:hypothetical protein
MRKEHVKQTVLAASLLMLAGLCAQGCASMAPAGPNGHTDAGVVEMDWRSRRNLELAEHTFGRDRFGQLVVNVRLVNTSAEPYYARFCVDFVDGEGGYERRAHQTDTEKLPVGVTEMEWASYRPDASRYILRIRSARFWQW